MNISNYFTLLLLLYETGQEKPSEALLTWEYVQSKIPWAILILLGKNILINLM